MEQLSLLEQLLNTIRILDIPGTVITVVNPDLTIRSVNPTAYKIFGGSHEPGYELIGNKCHEAYRNCTLPCKDCLVVSTLEADKEFPDMSEHYNEMVNKHFLVSTTPVRNKEQKLIGVIEVAQDITEKVKSKANIIKTDRIIAVGAYAIGIAHDLNNLMQQIIGPLGLLKELIEDNNKQEALKYIQTISNAVTESASLMDKLLKYRHEDNTRQPVDIEQLLQKTCDFFEKRCKQQNILLFRELEPVLPFEGYSQNIERVFMNLLLNAVESFDGREQNEKMIYVRCYHRDGYVCAEFEDNGCGIPFDKQHEIFNMDYTTKKFGNGIGLAASKQTIEEHHSGKILVESYVNKGSKFIVKVPDPTTLKIMRQDTWFFKT